MALSEVGQFVEIAEESREALSMAVPKPGSFEHARAVQTARRQDHATRGNADYHWLSAFIKRLTHKRERRKPVPLEE